MANIVTLAQVHTHLRIPATYTADDGILQYLMNAADEVIRFECDEILPNTYVERHDGGDFRIYTRRIPVIRVANIEEGWGWVNYELDFQEVNAAPKGTGMFGYSIDSFENGEISRRSFGSVNIPFFKGTKNILIEYSAGEEPIPGNIILAELELIAHWYQNALVRSVALSGSNMQYDATQGAVYSRDTESGIQNLNIGVPYRILELLKSHRHRPIIA